MNLIVQTSTAAIFRKGDKFVVQYHGQRRRTVTTYVAREVLNDLDTEVNEGIAQLIDIDEAEVDALRNA